MTKLSSNRKFPLVAAPVVMVVVVFAVPMAFVHLPALLVVVVVRMTPVSTGIRRTRPDTWHPDVTASAVAPVAFGPHKADSRHGRAHLVPKRRRCAADIHMNLSDGRRSKSGKSKATGKQVQLPVRAIKQRESPFVRTVSWMHTADVRRFISPAGGSPYFFNSGNTSGTTVRATIALPFAVA